MPTNNNADIAHIMTDDILADLERRITKVYGEAADDVQKTIDDYFAKFKEKDKKQLERLNSGEITDNEYKQWRLAQMGRGERYEALRDRLAERMTKANEVATAYINDTTPSIYSLNRNYAAYTIEKVAGNVGFDLFDESTVKRLIKENPDLMPNYPADKAIKRGIDLEYGKSQITKQVTSGILQGDSIPKLANRLQEHIPDMNRTSAVRAARTSVTGAQNAGRVDSYKSAEAMGIKLQKEWMATLDSRTRETHRLLDGVRVDTDDTFSNGCRYPGDPSGEPEEVYNCRCTLVAYMPEVEQLRGNNVSFEEWQEKKQLAKFTPASSIEEAEKYAERFVSSLKTKYTGNVDYNGVDLTYANEMNRALTEVLGEYNIQGNELSNIKPFNMREARFKGTTAEAAYQWGMGDLLYNKNYVKSAKAMNAHIEQYNDLIKQVLPNIDIAISKTSQEKGYGAAASLEYLKALKATGRTNVYAPGAYGTTVHELGHYLDDKLFRKAYKEAGFDLEASFERFSGKISAYATSSQQEYVAESFAAYWKGETKSLDPDIVKIFEGSKKK